MQKITRKQLDTFLSKYATDTRILDVGSGGSSYGRYFPHRLTIDIDEKRKPDIVADAHDLPFKDEEFPMVLCTEVLEHTRDPRKVVSELKRVLQPGGLLVLSTRFVYPIHDAPHDYWRFTYFGMKELFSDWEILEIVPETHTFTTIGALLQRIVFQSRLRFNKITKAILLVLAKMFTMLEWLVVQEFGDIKKETKVNDILVAGYYISCKKRLHN